jgi:hypothetical protein
MSTSRSHWKPGLQFQYVEKFVFNRGLLSENPQELGHHICWMASLPQVFTPATFFEKYYVRNAACTEFILSWQQRIIVGPCIELLPPYSVTFFTTWWKNFSSVNTTTVGYSSVTKYEMTDVATVVMEEWQRPSSGVWLPAVLASWMKYVNRVLQGLAEVSQPHFYGNEYFVLIHENYSRMELFLFIQSAYFFKLRYSGMWHFEC